MIPITRKELYLNKIVGNDDYDIPEKPITEEEFFFAEILGEAVQAPEPLTRYQLYLAKIAGKDVEIPYPETRLEYFLARAAGMNVETPVPITREEIYWSNYTAIVEFELENVPPLTYKAIEGTLKNYRIYGNTVNGESVGDLVTDSQSEHYGEYAIPITHNAETANIYLDEPLRKVGNEAEYVDYAEQKRHRVRKNLLMNTATSRTINGVTFTVNSDGSVTCNGTASVTTWFALNTSFDIYSPDGRIVSIGNNGSTSTFYLNISYIGNITSSSNYSKKIHQNVYVQIVITAGYNCDNLTFYPMIREANIEDDTYEAYIENTDLNVTLPALPTLTGTNTLSVGTAVQPSKLYIKGKKGRE